MSVKKFQILSAQYMHDFHCIGSSCEDSCCVGWRVDIDKKTYLKYRNLREASLKPLIKTYIKRTKDAQSDYKYARIDMVKDSCPFLDEKRLCNIQKTVGESYLSLTCRTYPRVMNRTDHVFEYSAVLSCPEIARLALLNENGVAFDIKEDVIPQMAIKDVLEGSELENRHFNQIRLFSLNLLQDRRFSLSERLIFLGIIYKQIEALENTEEIPDYIEKLSDQIDAGSYGETFKNIPDNLSMQLRLAKKLADKKIIQGINSPRFLDHLKCMMVAIGFDGKNSDEILTENYRKMLKTYYAPFMDEKSYIMENYLVNQFFGEHMPYGGNSSLWESYVRLCTLYSIMKLVMIGVSGYRKNMTDELAVSVIQSFSKAIAHNKQYVDGILAELKAQGFDTLAYMSILVKN